MILLQKRKHFKKKISDDNTMTIDMKIKMNNFIEVVSKILLNLIESSSSSNALVKKDSKPKSDEKDKS